MQMDKKHSIKSSLSTTQVTQNSKNIFYRLIFQVTSIHGFRFKRNKQTLLRKP